MKTINFSHSRIGFHIPVPWIRHGNGNLQDSQQCILPLLWFSISAFNVGEGWEKTHRGGWWFGSGWEAVYKDPHFVKKNTPHIFWWYHPLYQTTNQGEMNTAHWMMVGSIPRHPGKPSSSHTEGGDR